MGYELSILHFGLHEVPTLWVDRQATVTVGCLVSCSVQEGEKLGQLKCRSSPYAPHIQDVAIVLVHLLTSIQSTQNNHLFWLKGEKWLLLVWLYLNR